MSDHSKSSPVGQRFANGQLLSDADRRPTRRTRSLLSGLVSYCNGAQVFSCVVRNFSESGACITLPLGVFLPDQLFLIPFRHHIAHEAIVIWCSKRQAGLKFERSLTLGEKLDDKLAYLNKLWHGSACLSDSDRLC